MTLDAFRSRRAAEKRAAVLKAASAAFVEDGYAGARIDRIAKAADVSTATVYSYFSSKAGLFEAVVESAAGRFEISGAGGLADAARAYAALLSDPEVRGVLRLVAAESPRFPELGAALFDRGKARVYAAFGDAFRREAEAGRIDRAADWTLQTGQITGMITQAVLMPWLLTGREPVRAPMDVADAAAAVFLKG